MFWSEIRKKLIKLGANFESWSADYMVIESHDSICGLKGVFPNGNNFSIVSHKYSYGGTDDKFEIMAESAFDDVEGHLSEEEAIKFLELISRI